MKIRKLLKRYKTIQRTRTYILYFRNHIKSYLDRRRISKKDKKIIDKIRTEVRSFYPTNLNLTTEYFHDGRNILGYPDIFFIKKDGEYIGVDKRVLSRNGLDIFIEQCKTDVEFNFPKIIDTYRPEVIIEFGTAYGATSVLFYELASKYCQPKILSIDVDSKNFDNSRDFHVDYRTKEKISFLIGNSLECISKVKDFISANRKNGKVMLVFDDNHSHEHTLKELISYGPILNKGDVIWMMDTWIQDELIFATSPLLSVFKFINTNPGYILDYDLLKKMVLPFNFPHGILLKIK